MDAYLMERVEALAGDRGALRVHLKNLLTICEDSKFSAPLSEFQTKRIEAARAFLAELERAKQGRAA